MALGDISPFQVQKDPISRKEQVGKSLGCSQQNACLNQDPKLLQSEHTSMHKILKGPVLHQLVVTATSMITPNPKYKEIYPCPKKFHS